MKQTFANYLAQPNLMPDTITQAEKHVADFTDWLKENKVSLPRVNNSHVIAYIEHQQGQNLEVLTINLKLAKLRHYYNYLGTKTNPFEDVRVKGHRYRVFSNLLTEHELMELYIDLPEETPTQLWVKLLTGFYVFQGISTRDLPNMKVWHINLDTKTIIIPHTRRGNKRVLPIHPLQIPLLKQLHEVDGNVALISAFGDAKQLGWVTSHLHDSLREHADYKSLYQHRHSVVMNWLKICNLRPKCII